MFWWTRLAIVARTQPVSADYLQVFFWTTIKKNRTKYSQSRCASEDQVYNILFQDIVLSKDVDKAETHLLEVPGLQRFFNGLKSAKEKDDFRKHMRKYIRIWLPDCPFEVSTTNRYTITQHEASTTARHKIARGDTIKYLCGNLVAMTPEEEAELDLNRRDFSVVKQQRKKTSSLFLGPARFSNHDCKANARLCQQGDEGMTIVALRDIAIGEEVTVDYGDHYFGTNNRDCLCVTCEGKGRNAWAPLPDIEVSRRKKGLASPESSRESSLQSGSRKRNADTDANLEHSRRSKRVKRNSGANSTGLATPDSTGKSSPRSDEDACDDAPDDYDSDHDSELSSVIQLSSQVLSTISPKSFYGSKKSAHLSAQAIGKKSLEEAADPVDQYVNTWLGTGVKPVTRKPKSFWLSSGLSACVMGDRMPIFPGENVKIEDECGEDHQGSSFFRRRPTFGLTPPSSSVHSSTPVDPDDNDRRIGSRAMKGRPPKPLSKLSASTKSRYARDFGRGGHPVLLNGASARRGDFRNNSQSPESSQEESSDEDSDSDSGERMERTPGDYIRTKLLLPVPSSLWCDCMTCHNTWVQSSDEMKRECPRCERHSKLYGFRWPKTEKKKGDTEERITDHRLINRALSHKERKELGGRRGRGLSKPENAGTGFDYSDDEAEDDGARRLRNTQARAGQTVKPVEVDRKTIENSDKRIVKGKGWYMMVDT